MEEQLSNSTIRSCVSVEGQKGAEALAILLCFKLVENRLFLDRP